MWSRPPFALANVTFEKAVVLVVNMSEPHREMVREMLLKIGFNVEEAENENIALDLIKKKSPNLIIMDIKMMELDGINMIQKFKTNPEMKNIPLVAFTAAPSAGNGETIMKNGFDAHLIRPLKVNDLLSVLKKFLKYSIHEIPEVSPGSPEALDFKGVTEPAELMQILNGDIKSSCLSLREVMIMSKVKQLGEKIESIAIKHRIKTLHRYGSRIIAHADSFDTAGIEQELDELAKRIEKLNEIWEESCGK